MESNLFEKRRLFGTDGVRWIVDREGPDFALRLSMAIGSYFGEGARVLVGRDGRFGSEAVYGSVLSGLASVGAKVYDCGLIPTPALQFCVSRHGFDYGVVVTASHNPPEWAGIKVVMGDGIEAPPNVELEIERLFFEGKFRRVSWYGMRGIERFDYAVDYYIASLKRLFDANKIRERGLKVVVDCANSVGALTTPRLLKELGVKALTLNADVGLPYRPYEPTEGSLADFVTVVKAAGADFGVAHDGDADRAVFVDGRGRVIPGDVTATILSEYIANSKVGLPKRVVTAISTSHLLVEKNLISKGIEVVWTRVGFANIARKIVELGGALAGFEDNGGFAYVLHQPVRDGAATAALMCELLSESHSPLAELVDSLEKPVIVRSRIPILSREEARSIIERVKERYAKGLATIEIDGIKILAKDFALLVRPSGTEPLLRVMVESWDERLAREVMEEVSNLIKTELRGSKQ